MIAPGFGESDVLPTVSFRAFGQAISDLLDRLAVGPRYIKLLETHAAAAAPLMRDFIRHTQRESERAGKRE
ncbi:MAG TPA: hypothetical protein VGX71_23615 [Pseudaminobacter sp.]|nr:hypothetical protein [Pseudaminobacter sp.]